ncbi:MAG: transposase [Chloroflexota bacterium]
MILTAKIKLQPNETQHDWLLETLERANQACQAISDLAWEHRVFSKFRLQEMCYYDVRERFSLSAQMTIRCLAKVADAYKLDKRKCRRFRSRGSIAYDDRILSFGMNTQTVSIWTLEGRETIPFQAGQHQLDLLQHQQGESKLAYQRGCFYLLVSCEVEAPKTSVVQDFIGVDMGIVNIATTSDGQSFSGKTIQSVRHRNRRLRKKLQQKGTKSAKRLLRHLSGREKRFVNDVNHCISKQIVQEAQRTKRGVAVEEMTGIRSRIRVRKSQRTQLHSWSFGDLGLKLCYKAKKYGVVFVEVDPAYTSQMCSCCGEIDKASRQTQSKYQCTSCGFVAHADVNAAINIGCRGVVMRPHADSELGLNPA